MSYFLRKTKYLKNTSLAILLILLLLTSVGFYIRLLKISERRNMLVITDSSEREIMPVLYTRGNRIKRKDTNAQIILRGAASDAFRYPKGKYENLNELLRRLDILASAGGNLITFWITPEGVAGKDVQLNKVVEHTYQKGIYVIFAPLTGVFPIAPSEAERPVMNRLDGKENAFISDNQKQVEELMESLAARFKNQSNIIYGVGAEPTMTWRDWELPATKIIEKIRSQNPESLIFVPCGNVGKDIGWPLSYQNIIYGTEQYLAYDGQKLKEIQSAPGYIEKYTWQNPEYSKYPLLITEMGGTIASDFGSPEDLSVIDRMLNDLESRDFSYQMHSLDSYKEWTRPDGKVVEISGLGMFDRNGKLTAKGELIFKHLKNNPGTRVAEQ